MSVTVLSGSTARMVLRIDRIGVMPLPAAIITYDVARLGSSGVLKWPIGVTTSIISPGVRRSNAYAEKTPPGSRFTATRNLPVPAALQIE